MTITRKTITRNITRKPTRRNGQAALEYLVTYGWGFVVILVVVGALAYFGFLNPSRYIPSRCSFGAQMECVDYKLESDPALNNHGVVYLNVRNNFGDTINIVSVATTSKTSTNSTMNVVVPKGTTSSLLVLKLQGGDPITLVKGDRATVPLVITFRRDTSRFPNSPEHNVTGDIYTNSQ